MNRKIGVFLTGVSAFLLVLYLIIEHAKHCYPGFLPIYKTAGDGCDVAYFFHRIGILPYLLVVLSSFIGWKFLIRKKKVN